MGAKNDVPAFAGGAGAAGSIREVRGWSGGVVRRVAASRCEADGTLEPGVGVAAARISPDLAGSGTVGGAVAAGVEVVRPVIGGSGMSCAVGASPGSVACEVVAAGRGGMAPAAAARAGWTGALAAGGGISGRVRIGPMGALA
jgi:hypothetical protein